MPTEADLSLLIFATMAALMFSVFPNRLWSPLQRPVPQQAPQSSVSQPYLHKFSSQLAPWDKFHLFGLGGLLLCPASLHLCPASRTSTENSTLAHCTASVARENVHPVRITYPLPVTLTSPLLGWTRAFMLKMVLCKQPPISKVKATSLLSFSTIFCSVPAKQLLTCSYNVVCAPLYHPFISNSPAKQRVCGWILTCIVLYSLFNKHLLIVSLS